MPELIKTCKTTGRQFRITEQEQDLLEKLSQRNPYLQEPIPLPDLSPAESLRRTYCWGNLRWLARRPSALSGKPHLARFATDDLYHTVSPEEFWSDEVDNTKFGRPYDFSRSFFEQFDELMREVWHLSLNAPNVEASDYVNGAADCKNCYLCFSVSNSQDCLYCMEQRFGNDNLFCLATFRCQYCHQCVSISNCYECRYCSDCDGCSQSFACIDCRSCSNCIGCIGLEHKQHYIFNQQKSPREFEEFVAKYLNGSHLAQTDLLRQCRDFCRKSGHQINRIINSEDCIGANITNCKNVRYSYQALESRDCVFTTPALQSQDAARGAMFMNCELVYQGAFLKSNNCAFCYTPASSEAAFYCYQIYNQCAYCFGCAGLKRSSYSILNRQYSKQEYFELVPRIVRQMKQLGEWGSYFPAKFSPHYYEESWAPDVIGALTTEELTKRGYRLRGIKPPAAAVEAGDVSAIPDSVSGDKIMNYSGKVFRCPETGQNFNLQRKEIEFYRRFNIPLPRIGWHSAFDSLIAQRLRPPEDLGCID